MPVEHFHTARAREARQHLKPFIEFCLSNAFSQKQIAEALNNLGARRALGGKWYQPHVSLLLKELGLSTNRAFLKAIYPIKTKAQ